MVYSVDSSLHGFGIVKSTWNVEDVKLVGRVAEKMRYKLDGEQARWSALSAAGFSLDEFGKIHHDAGYHATDSADNRMWIVNSDFPEVPPRLLAKSNWKHVIATVGTSKMTF